MGEKEKSSIAFFTTYRPAVPLDIYSSPIATSESSSMQLMTDSKSYNYNGHQIPPGALKTILRHTDLGNRVSTRLVDEGKADALIFVSERTDGLETLHILLSVENMPMMIYSLGKLYEDFLSGGRMEDSPCFAGDRYLIFVSTYHDDDDETPKPRQPWNAVFRTDLTTGDTIRLTPQGVADFSASVSPSGRKIAVATLEHKEGGWTGEIEDLQSDIVVMDVIDYETRQLVIKNGGWPSWGSNDIIFFHRAALKRGPNYDKLDVKYYNWGVFRASFGGIGFSKKVENRVTPEGFDAMTPAAIDTNRVAVAIIRNKLDLVVPRTSSYNYRHIQVFDIRSSRPYSVTRYVNETTDHYNPFVIKNYSTGEVHIGYNNCSIDERLQIQKGQVTDKFEKVETDGLDEVGVFRVPGVFPTFTKDGKKLAFVDNDFQNVYLADDKGGVRPIFSVSWKGLQLREDEKSVFSPVWNQDQKRDTLYVCVGPSFSAEKQVHIYAIYNASDNSRRRVHKLTNSANNAFPCTNPQGTRLAFRSTRDWVGKANKWKVTPKNLYIMEDPLNGDKGKITRMTNGDWIDTHCQWSPNGKWIVFSSTRDKSPNSPRLDNGLDPGYYAVYLMDANNLQVVRVISSGSLGAGHVNHPTFSPDGEALVFSADLAGVSVEPISLPLFIHSVRPYGDIFLVPIDQNDIRSNKDLREFGRVTHSRYENSTPSWSYLKTKQLSSDWDKCFKKCRQVTWSCPASGGSWKTNAALTGQLGLPKRCC